MKFLILTLVLVTSSVSSTLAQSKKAAKLRQVELARFEAMTAQDTAKLATVLSDELTYTHSNGLSENKSDHLINIAAGNIVYQSMQSEKMDIKVHGRAAVITGIVHVKGLYQGQEFDIKLGYTDAYFKEKGNWKLVAWQSGRIN